jgi:NADH-quinone oxidoreductase subunit N
LNVDYAAIAPELIVVATLSLVLLTDLALPDDRKWMSMPVALAGVVGALVMVLAISGKRSETLSGMFVIDQFAILFKVVFLLAALLVFAMSHDYLKDDRIHQGEYYFLILSSLLGMLVIASSRDLIAIFVALETISIPTFVLAGLRKSDLKSNEASLKFFLFGVLSTALMLYGMSLVYGMTGNTNLNAIATALDASPPEPSLAVLAVFFIIVGFGFKVSAFPFQWWVPDTYEGAPVPIAAFLSVASKTAGFVGLVLIMFLAFGGLADVWRPFLAIVAAMTMTFGNLVALRQRHIVRMLAYSSIGQAGYILVPLGIISATDPEINQQALIGAIVYLLIYAFMETGAFAVAVAYGKKGGGYFIDDYAGLSKTSPLLALTMVAFLFSLAGVPPFAGWAAKLFVFLAAIRAGQGGIDTAGWLVVIMAINTVIALFYYANVVRLMLFEAPREGTKVSFLPPLLRTAIVIPAVVVMVIGILPGLFSNLAGASTFVSP